MMYLTSLLSMNSHNPSLARIKNKSSWFILYSIISGSEIIPTEAPILSPNDLDIASPGIFLSLSQTLLGPMKVPFSSINNKDFYLYKALLVHSFPLFLISLLDYVAYDRYLIFLLHNLKIIKINILNYGNIFQLLLLNLIHLNKLISLVYK